MNEAELLQSLDSAIAEARAWARIGWSMTFGRSHVPVTTLSEAQAQSERFVHRQEALAYWRSVAEAGEETALKGEQAKAAIGRRDYRFAEGAVYFALFVEKRLNKPSSTWEPVLAGVKSLIH
ncbi:MAG: hypothetical protein HQM02_13930 [Magnetococcales bacterium]|nr:hypothetical protein [Magnetococcales bacterium]